MTLLKSLFNKKMNRTIYIILFTSISFFLMFYFHPSLSTVYENLGGLISGKPILYIRVGPYSFPIYEPLSLTFICTYLFFHSIFLALISIPRMNDCRTNRWLALFLLIPEFNYIIVLLLMLLPKAKNADQERSSIWSDLRKAVVALFLTCAVALVVTFVGAIVMYGIGLERMQEREITTQ